MEATEEKKVRRYFTAEQKYQMLKEIEGCGTLKEGLEKYDLEYSVYRRWKRQLEVGVRATLIVPRKSRSPRLSLLTQKGGFVMSKKQFQETRLVTRRILRRIFFVRGQKVILDADLAQRVERLEDNAAAPSLGISFLKP